MLTAAAGFTCNERVGRYVENKATRRRYPGNNAEINFSEATLSGRPAYNYYTSILNVISERKIASVLRASSVAERFINFLILRRQTELSTIEVKFHSWTSSRSIFISVVKTFRRLIHRIIIQRNWFFHQNFSVSSGKSRTYTILDANKTKRYKTARAWAINKNLRINSTHRLDGRDKTEIRTIWSETKRGGERTGNRIGMIETTTELVFPE